MEMAPVASQKVLAAHVPVIGVHSRGTGRNLLAYWQTFRSC